MISLDSVKGVHEIVQIVIFSLPQVFFILLLDVGVCLDQQKLVDVVVKHLIEASQFLFSNFVRREQENSSCHILFSLLLRFPGFNLLQKVL